MSRSPLRAEDGVTLVELLVTAVLLSVVLSVAASASITAQRTAADAGQRLADLGEAQVAIDAAGRSLRMAVRVAGAASPFISRTPDAVEFYSNIDVSAGAGPRKVRLALQGDELVEVITPATPSVSSWTWDPADARTRVLARGPTAAEVFTYYCGTSECTAAAASSAITSVRVRVVVAPSGALAAPPTELRTTVRIANFHFVPAA